MPLPFWSPVYRATVEAVRDALKPDVSNSELGKISDIRAHEISWLLHRRGHTQGIAVGAGRVLVSVEEKKVSSKKSYDGHFLVYQTPLQSGDGASVEINLRDDLPGDGWPHAVVGQGVLGRSISDSVGRHFPNELGMLCPVTNGRQGDFPGDPFDGAPTDLRDRDGRRIATHWHREADVYPGDERYELQTPAMIVFKGRLYLVALRHQYLYVYEIHWFGGASADAATVWEQVVALDISSDDDCRTEHPGGTYAKFESYGSINLLLAEEGNVFLLCTHDRWLDTWHMGLLNPPGAIDDENRPTLTKIAVMEHNWAGGADLFEQGVAIFQHPEDNRRVGFLSAPWDFRHSRCPNPTDTAMCTNLWAWDREF